MRGTGVKGHIVPAGQPAGPGNSLNPSINGVSLAYFATVGMRIVAGRGFTDHESSTPPIPTIVNEAFVGRFFVNQNPLGQRLGPPDHPNNEIIGVVTDAKYHSLREEMTPTFYTAAEPGGRATILHVRTAPQSAKPETGQNSVVGKQGRAAVHQERLAKASLENVDGWGAPLRIPSAQGT